MKIYNMLLRLPLASKVKDKLLCKFDAIEYENQLLAEQIIDLRIQLKVLQGKKNQMLFFYVIGLQYGGQQSLFMSI